MNGNLIAEAETGEDGTFQADIGSDAVSPGDVLTVVAEDEAGNTGQTADVTVPGDEAGAGTEGDQVDDESTAAGGSESLPNTGVPAAPIGVAAALLLAAGTVLTFFRRKPNQ